MADESDDSSKTEEPTQRRLEEAHERGDVAKSNELPTVFILFGATLVLAFSSGPAATHFAKAMQGVFANAAQLNLDGASLVHLALKIVLAALGAVGILFGGLMAFGLAGHLVQHRLVWSLDPVTPKWERISPLAGFKRIFSGQSVINLVKGLIKIAIVGCAIWLALWPERDRFDAMIDMEVAQLLPVTLALVMKMMMAVLSIMFLIAAADFIYQRTKWYNRLRMTVRELKEEFKNQEGNPEIKARVRKIRRERARKRMMSEVPKAAVVITNPTHFAVALHYSKGMRAPVCVAKGKDKIALKIREVARENGVPIVENPPLARALHAGVEIDDEIPTEHYKAVAQVIGYVMTLKTRRRWAA